MRKYNYLTDESFLEKIDSLHNKTKFIKIIVLDWNENPIQDIVGNALGGSINLDGTSGMRRTANLSMFLPNADNEITNVNHLLSINKKIKLEIGIKNVTNEYKSEDIIWFPMGTYIITQPSISNSVSGYNISLQLKDKMALLNGDCGGLIPATVNFSELETIDSKGNRLITRPTIYQIIQELVNHWGGEQLGKIFIEDLETQIKKVMKWTSTDTLFAFNEGNGIEFTIEPSRIEKKQLVSDVNALFSTEDSHGNNFYMEFQNGDDVGYIFSDFTYPGEDLIANAGTSVTSILDTIRDMLGNFEYFYDINGNFHFQAIKNALNISNSSYDLVQMENSGYLLDVNNNRNTYTFKDSSLIISQSNNPQYESIKNDFIVWGKRKDPNGKAWPIRYHLAIDEKPQTGFSHEVIRYKDSEDGLDKAKGFITVNSIEDFPRPGMVGVIYRIKEFGVNQFYEWSIEAQDYKKLTNEIVIQNVVAKDWRTELYLQGVESAGQGLDSNQYYVELQNEWCKIYDIWGGLTTEPDFRPAFKRTQRDGDYFLDFIDSSSALGEFSIKNIGKRTKIIDDSNINCLVSPPVLDLILFEQGKASQEEIEQCRSKGQNYTVMPKNFYASLAPGGHFNSALDLIKDLLYQHTGYNENISLEVLPIYHLDVNTKINLTSPTANIKGDYIINNMSIPLDMSGTMSISATKILKRI